MADDVGPFAGLPDIFTGTFGEPVDYRPLAGGTLPLAGVFIKPFAMAIMEEVELEGYSAELHVRAEDVAEPQHGDELTVRETDFRVVGVEPDGKGMIRLKLMEA